MLHSPCTLAKALSITSLSVTNCPHQSQRCSQRLHSMFPMSVHLSQSHVATLVRAERPSSGMMLTASLVGLPDSHLFYNPILRVSPGDPLKRKLPPQSSAAALLSTGNNNTQPPQHGPSRMPAWLHFCSPYPACHLPAWSGLRPTKRVLLRLPNPQAAIKCDSASMSCPGVSCSQALLKYHLH